MPNSWQRHENRREQLLTQRRVVGWQTSRTHDCSRIECTWRAAENIVIQLRISWSAVRWCSILLGPGPGHTADGTFNNGLNTTNNNSPVIKPSRPEYLTNLSMLAFDTVTYWKKIHDKIWEFTRHLRDKLSKVSNVLILKLTSHQNYNVNKM